jgi:hypothetical protein
MQFRTLVTLTLFAMTVAASPTTKPDDKTAMVTNKPKAPTKPKPTNKPKPTKKPKPAKPTTKKPVASKGPVKKE